MLTLGKGVSSGLTVSLETKSNARVINSIKEGSPAHSNGRLHAQDKIVEINNKNVQMAAVDDIQEILNNTNSAQNIAIVVSRVVPVSQLTREQEFFGRHGHARLQATESEPTTWQEGLLATGKEESSELVVSLKHDFVFGFGFNVIGPDPTSAGQQKDGIYVSSVYAGSAAAQNPKFRRGLQVTDINGWDLHKANVIDAERIIAGAVHRGDVIVTLRNNPEGFAAYETTSWNKHFQAYIPPSSKQASQHSRPQLRTVVLDRESVDTSLGLALAGPTTYDDQVEPRGIYIAKIDESGLAAKSGQLKQYDQIVGINGYSLTKATHSIAAQTMRQAGTHIVLSVAHNPFGHDFQAKIIESAAKSSTELLKGSEPRPIRLVASSPAYDFGITLVGPSELNEPREGVYVGRISNQATIDSGLTVGDLIIEINDEKTILSSAAYVSSLLTGASEARMVVTRHAKGFGKIKHKLGAVDRKIQLTKTEIGLGIKLIGPDTVSANSHQGIYVSFIDPEGPAGVDGRLVVGDQILSINSIKLDNLTRLEASAILAQAGSIVSLSAVSNPQGYAPYKDQVAQIQKSVRKASENRRRASRNSIELNDKSKTFVIKRSSDSAPFGFNICGPRDQTDTNHVGIFVISISPDSVVAQEGSLRVGDQLLSVNGVDLRSSTAEEATAILKKSGTVCVIDLLTYSYDSFFNL